jgi:hypothetical protein
MQESIFLPVIRNTAALESTVWMLDNQSNLKKLNQETDSFEVVIPGGRLLTVNGIQTPSGG